MIINRFVCDVVVFNASILTGSMRNKLIVCGRYDLANCCFRGWSACGMRPELQKTELSGTTDDNEVCASLRPAFWTQEQTVGVGNFRAYTRSCAVRVKSKCRCQHDTSCVTVKVRVTQ